MRYQPKYGNVQVDSDNVQKLEQRFFIDDNFSDCIFFTRLKKLVLPLIFQQTHSTYSAHVFAKTLDSFNPNRIRNWKKSANIFWKEYVIIPVCTGTHWMFVIVKVNHNDGVSIMILDSANRPSLSSNKYIVHRLTV